MPDGRTEGTITFSQVQNDKTPMPAPDGVSFDVAWSLQPAGTVFDPPARVSVPNSNGGLPGQEFDMVTFDHDLMVDQSFMLDSISSSYSIDIAFSNRCFTSL